MESLLNSNSLLKNHEKEKKNKKERKYDVISFRSTKREKWFDSSISFSFRERDGFRFLLISEKKEETRLLFFKIRLVSFFVSSFSEIEVFSTDDFFSFCLLEQNEKNGTDNILKVHEKNFKNITFLDFENFI